MRGVLADGRSIRELRLAQGLTQAQVAQQAQCDVKTVRRAEQGQQVDVAVLRGIAAALGVRYADLVAGPGADRATKDNLMMVQNWLAAFENRDLAALVRAFRRSGSLRVAGAPDVPAAGVFRGHAAIRQHYDAFFAAFEVQRVPRADYSFDAVEELVLLRGSIRLRSKIQDQACQSEVIHAFRFDRGKIAELTVYCDTLALYRITQSQPAGP